MTVQWMTLILPRIDLYRGFVMYYVLYTYNNYKTQKIVRQLMCKKARVVMDLITCISKDAEDVKPANTLNFVLHQEAHVLFYN